MFSQNQNQLDLILQRDDIGRFRRISATVLKNQWFNMGISAIILLNIVVMIIDANFLGQCVLTGVEACELEELPWTRAAEYVFLGVYIFELLLRFLAERWSFFDSSWNLLDCAVVLSAIVELALSFMFAGNMLGLLQVLRLFRIARILRATRLLRFFPHLFLMVQGFLHAIVAMGWGLVLILILLVMISVIAVEIIAPHNVEHEAEWCVEAFGSVWTATIFFFQITVAGDSWGACAIPIMREHVYTGIVFVGAVCLVQLGFMNLILSAILQMAQEAQENDVQQQKQHILRKKQDSAAELTSIFQQIDGDGSGTLTYQELLAAYDDKDGKANSILTLLGLGRRDLPELFQLMDLDSSDAIGHKEFVECIRKAQVQDIRMQMLTMKLQLDKISRSVGKEVKKAVRACLMEKGLVTKASGYENVKESRTEKEEGKSWTEKASAVSDLPSKEDKLRETDKDAFLLHGAASPGQGPDPTGVEPQQRQAADELPRDAEDLAASDVGQQARAVAGEQHPKGNGMAAPVSPRRRPARLMQATPRGCAAAAPADGPPESANRVRRQPAGGPAVSARVSTWQRELQETNSSAPKQAALKEHFLQLHEFTAALRGAEPGRLQDLPP